MRYTYAYIAITEAIMSFQQFNEKDAKLILDIDGNTYLHNAVRGNDLSAVKGLLAVGADINARNTSRESPLSIAIANLRTIATPKTIANLRQNAFEEYSFSVIEEMLASKQEISSVNIREIATEAIRIGSINTLNACIKNYPTEMKKEIDFILTALPFNESGQRARYLKLFVENGWVTKPNEETDKIFLEAVKNKEREDVKYFIQKGLAPKEQSWLSDALALNDTEITTLILMQNNNINLGELLHSAAKNKNIELVKTLLKAGADPNHQDENGYSPLHQAVFKLDPVIAEVLMNAGADPLLDSWYHFARFIPFIASTPLDFAARDRDELRPSPYQNVSLKMNFLMGFCDFFLRAIRANWNKGEDHLKQLLLNHGNSLEQVTENIKKPYPELLKAMMVQAVKNEDWDAIKKMFSRYDEQQLRFLGKNKSLVEKIYVGLNTNNYEMRNQEIIEQLKNYKPDLGAGKMKLFGFNLLGSSSEKAALQNKSKSPGNK